MNQHLGFRNRSFGVLLIILSVWRGSSVRAEPVATEIPYLKAALIPGSNLLPFSHLEVNGVQNISLLNARQVRPNSRLTNYIGLNLLANQSPLNGGVRSEVSVDYPFSPKNTVLYRWYFKFPTDFIEDPQNRWWLIGQWHDQPNVTIGETWANFPDRSPPVSIVIGKINNKLEIGLAYGTSSIQVVGHKPISKGIWHSLVMIIHWSMEQDGGADFYLDTETQPTFSARGPNMHNNYQHYLKVGMYRDAAINTNNTLYINDISIQNLGNSPLP